MEQNAQLTPKERRQAFLQSINTRLPNAGAFINIPKGEILVSRSYLSNWCRQSGLKVAIRDNGDSLYVFRLA